MAKENQQKDVSEGTNPSGLNCRGALLLVVFVSLLPLLCTAI